MFCVKICVCLLACVCVCVCVCAHVCVLAYIWMYAHVTTLNTPVDKYTYRYVYMPACTLVCTCFWKHGALHT
jgi:hypothetical protein